MFVIQLVEFRSRVITVLSRSSSIAELGAVVLSSSCEGSRFTVRSFERRGPPRPPKEREEGF